MPPKRTDKYQRKNDIDHVLDRPDTYVGSKRVKSQTEYILSSEYKITKKDIKYSPALLRIFIEVLSNAIDNHKRSQQSGLKCTKIKVNIDKDTGLTSIWNDGEYIPIEKKYDDVSKVERYIHSMVFGTMHSSSNYDDTEERDVSGRNGIGIKACNILSSHFQVKGGDPETELELTQVWKNNMKETTTPTVKKKTSVKKGFTEVSWVPDFEWFGIKGYSTDIVRLYSKYVVDAAMLTGVSVYLNDKLIPVKNMKDYAKLYTTEDEVIHVSAKNAEVVLTPAEEFEAVSFVNGVYTSRGGKHVDAWGEEIFRPIVKKFNKKDKPQVNIKDVKQFFRLFVNCTVVNPEFESQSKHELTAPEVKAVLPQRYITAILKWSVMSKIENVIKMKEMMTLKKTENKTRGYKKVEGLDHANNAGGKHSTDCILIICEGKSAKTYAVAGIEKGAYGKKGRDWFGIYPVRGKILNVRNATMKAISENKVILDLINALGVRYDTDYTVDANFKTLRYGKVMYLTDQDHDGTHIGSLGLNKFHVLFPSLLKRDEPFTVKMETPIAKVFTRPSRIFFDERDYNDFMLSTDNKYKAKYYKGLGTSSADEVTETFGLKITEFVCDKNIDTTMNKVFLDKQTDNRKTWIAEYNPLGYKKFVNDKPISSIGISDYLDNYTIQFSIADNQRSLPHLMDGLKECQRKVLYACFKRKLTGESVKVAQLSGYVSEHTNYHHGEESLNGTIIGMASCFVGGNNIPLLQRNGAFGTRLEGGKDAAKPRYIFTKLEKITRMIYRPEDDILLTRVIDDGDMVQPEYYVPVIPMILVNPGVGIGTGWSSTMPAFNPFELSQCVRSWLENMDDEPEYPDMKPWYRGFKGRIEKDTRSNRYTTYGICTNTSKGCKITELPIGKWTSDFKEKLEEYIEAKNIKKFSNYSTPTVVDFDITPNSNFTCNTDSLKLYSYISTNNMVMWDEKSHLKKYDTVYDIIDDFCNMRYEYYIKRKTYQLKQLRTELKYLDNKRKFLQEVMDGSIVVFKRKKQQIENDLEQHKYEKDTRSGSEGNYNYLSKLPLWIFTQEELDELEKTWKKLRQDIRTLENTSEKDIWLRELKEFEDMYKVMLTDLENCGKGGKKGK